MRTLVLCFFLVLGLAASAQAPNVAAQKAAMAKLQFLVGRWSGPISVQRGPGEPLKMTQTEEVESRLDGLVLTVEGTSRDVAGQVRFRAFATISYDDAAKTYHFRAYNDGRYLDTELTVPPDGFAHGFQWSFDGGAVHVTNTMHLSDDGQWVEQTESVYGQQPPRNTMQMVLTKR